MSVHRWTLVSINASSPPRKAPFECQDSACTAQGWSRAKWACRSANSAVRLPRSFAFSMGCPSGAFRLLGRLPGRVEAISRYAAHRATAIARSLRRGSALFPQAIAARLGERAPSGSRVIEILPTNAGVALRTRPRGGKRCVWARQAIVVTPACAGHVHRRKTRRTTSRLSPCRCLTAAIPAN